MRCIHDNQGVPSSLVFLHRVPIWTILPGITETTRTDIRTCSVCFINLTFNEVYLPCALRWRDLWLRYRRLSQPSPRRDRRFETFSSDRFTYLTFKFMRCMIYYRCDKSWRWRGLFLLTSYFTNYAGLLLLLTMTLNKRRPMRHDQDHMSTGRLLTL